MYTQEQLAVRALAKEFATNEIEPGASTRDMDSKFAKEILTSLGTMGFLGMQIPEQYGGAGLDFHSYLLALEEIAYCDASIAVAMSVNNSVVCEPIFKFGTESQKEKYLKPLASGASLGSFALSEPDAGSDAAALKTQAIPTDKGWILNGSKAWITNGSFASFFIVMAVTEPALGKQGISSFIVNAKEKGIHIGKPEMKMGLKSSNTVMINFENVFIPSESILGNPGDGLKVALGGLDAGRIGIAAQALGIAQRAHYESIKYAKERRAFGKPLFQHQSISTYLAEMEVKLLASRLLINRAADLKNSGKRYTLEASAAKLFTTESAVWICDRAVQIHGGYGYSHDYVVERLYRDVRVTTIYEGTSEIQRLVISKEIMN